MNKSKQIYTGTIQAYDAQTDKNSILFHDGRTVELEPEHVCKMGVKEKDQQQWSQENQWALGCLVLQVQDHIVSNTNSTLCTPYWTLLSSSAWTEMQTWQTCSASSARRSPPLDIQSISVYDGKVTGRQKCRDSYRRKHSSGCLETHWLNGRHYPHSTDSDGLCRLSESSRISTVQQSTWFGV